MPAPFIRPLLHAVHLLTFALLLVTGLLLFVPDLRALVTGGYSLLIRDVHRWGGVAFAALPLLILLRFGVRSAFAAPERPTARTRWQALHVAITIAMGVIFTLTGFALWGKRYIAEAIVDASRWAHDWLTYAAAALVVVHLAEVGVAAMVARLSAAAPSTRQPET